MLTKETAKGQFAETLNFTKMTPKFGENWLMKCLVVFSLLLPLSLYDN